VNFPSVAEQEILNKGCRKILLGFMGEIVVGLFINLHFPAHSTICYPSAPNSNLSIHVQYFQSGFFKLLDRTSI